jgi:hypothetical protein
MITYEVVADDATADSTVVEDEREVVADSSSFSSAARRSLIVVVGSSNANQNSLKDLTDGLNGKIRERKENKRRSKRGP